MCQQGVPHLLHETGILFPQILNVFLQSWLNLCSIMK